MCADQQRQRRRGGEEHLRVRFHAQNMCRGPSNVNYKCLDLHHKSLCGLEFYIVSALCHADHETAISLRCRRRSLKLDALQTVCNGASLNDTHLSQKQRVSSPAAGAAAGYICVTFSDASCFLIQPHSEPHPCFHSGYSAFVLSPPASDDQIGCFDVYVLTGWSKSASSYVWIFCVQFN